MFYQAVVKKQGNTDALYLLFSVIKRVCLMQMSVRIMIILLCEQSGKKKISRSIVGFLV